MANRLKHSWTDNIMVNALSCSSLPVLALLGHLVLRCLDLNVWFMAKHVPVVYNRHSDTLFYSQMLLFRELLLGTSLMGGPCPENGCWSKL